MEHMLSVYNCSIRCPTEIISYFYEKSKITGGVMWASSVLRGAMNHETDGLDHITGRSFFGLANKK